MNHNTEAPEDAEVSMAVTSDMLGYTFTSITLNDDKTEMRFNCKEGTFIFQHYQECCEEVAVGDITGDLQDLLDSPILRAEESTNQGNTEDGTYTWTFYKLATKKGYVDIRWVGESNGYYSESVDIYFIKAT
jgi:hypothetical protein